MKILIFGNGFIGARCKDAWGDDAVMSTAYISTMEDALAEIRKYQPDAVLNAAGVRGKPNVDWCETNQMVTALGNTVMPILLSQACQEAGVYMLHIGSGCIFYGDSPHEDREWREDDFGNPLPVYSRSKWAADLVLSTLPNVGVARIRMPIDHIPGSNNLINKLAGFPKVIDVENSVTIIDDLVDVLKQLMEKKGQGIFHATNPGTVRHRDIIGMYRELVDQAHTCEWIANDDLVHLGLATKGRSNNFLASTRLAEYGIVMRPAAEALRDTMAKFAEKQRALVAESSS